MERTRFIDFLGRAKASAGEVRSQLVIAYDQAYLSSLPYTLEFSCYSPVKCPQNTSHSERSGAESKNLFDEREN